jgi:integrase
MLKCNQHFQALQVPLNKKGGTKRMGLYRRNKNGKVLRTWWMSFTVEGKSHRISTGTTDKRLAEKAFAKMQTLIFDGRWRDFEDMSRRSLKEMIERYTSEYTNNKNHIGKARDISIFKALHAFFGEDAVLSDVGKKVGNYEVWRREGDKPVQPATIHKELSLLRRMFNIARKQWKWRITNPVSDIEMPKVRNERVRYLSDAEYSRLFNILDASEKKWLKPCVNIAIGTGLRLSNVIGLEWSEVNLATRVITFGPDKMKNKDFFSVPIVDNVYETLLGLQEVKSPCGYVLHDAGQALSAKKVQRAISKALQEADIANFRFHDFRHCFCSYLKQQGADLSDIADLVGHKDLRMTRRYTHLNVNSLRQVTSKLDNVFTHLAHPEAMQDDQVQ